MSEWFKEHDWKSCDGDTRPEVRILFSAPNKNTTIYCGVFSIFKAIYSTFCVYGTFMARVYPVIASLIAEIAIFSPSE